MKKISAIAFGLILLFSIYGCTCNCNRQYSHKMSSKLIEFLEYDDESDIKPFYAVEIQLNTVVDESLKSQVSGTGALIESTTEKTIIAKAKAEAIRKISKFGFVDYINLLTTNYYPNK